MRIRDLINALGGPSVVAAEVGLTVAAVGNWSLRNNLPADYHAPIWRMARKAKVNWTPPGFEGLPPPRKRVDPPEPLEPVEAAD